MSTDTHRKPYRIEDYESYDCDFQRAKSPVTLFDESSAIAKSPNSSSSSSVASSMGGGDEGTIGGIMLDMMASGYSITQEALCITIKFNIIQQLEYYDKYICLTYVRSCCYRSSQCLIKNLVTN
jgi:hypothetical protein